MVENERSEMQTPESQIKVTINNTPVEINAEKIEQLIINLLKKNENE